MSGLKIPKEKISSVKRLAKEIADDVQKFINQHSSTSTERAILRLMGVDGIDQYGTPLPNRLIELLEKQIGLSMGISKPFALAMLKSGRDVQITAELLCNEKIDFINRGDFSQEEIIKLSEALAQKAVAKLDKTKNVKKQKKEKYSVPPSPWKYLIVATGNIYEDRTQAKAAAYAGADIVAVIRTTAQSLLDYVPFGATTEGFGGTYATQENFKIMRQALDEASNSVGRYIRLVNYSSGLCMAEIAACAAIEDLDLLLNDSMYGILFRDINMHRTFIDQYFSRLICSRAKIIINTGEDNYLTTSDAIEKAYTVTASQLINEAMGHNALLTDDLLGLGHAFEIDPKVENAMLYELAHAELARALFPNAPLKYMPPTKHKSTDIFFSHAMDTMFNLVSVTTQQGIHLAGMPTEAIHTPLMQDRYKALSSINYVFNICKDLGNEIEYKQDGFIVKRALDVLNQVEESLKQIQKIGLMEAISQGMFADIKRTTEGGKGLLGVIKKGPEYSNPIMEILLKDGVIYE